MQYVMQYVMQYCYTDTAMQYQCSSKYQNVLDGAHSEVVTGSVNHQAAVVETWEVDNDRFVYAVLDTHWHACAWLRMQPKTFYLLGLEKLRERYLTCISKR